MMNVCKYRIAEPKQGLDMTARYTRIRECLNQWFNAELNQPAIFDCHFCASDF